MNSVSLRRQLLFWLLGPMILLLGFESLSTYNTAQVFANQAYDRSLLDSAVILSRQVRVNAGQVQVDLPAFAQNILEEDQFDRIYYRVSNLEGKVLAGHRSLPLPDATPIANAHIYFDARVQGQPVRGAAIYLPVPGHGLVVAEVAETLVKRHLLARDILSGILIPRLLLIALAALLIWFGVSRGLAPLKRLHGAIASRSHLDLSPVVEDRAPREVQSLILAINALLARLGESLSAKQRFIADAAHQLRTPLAGLKTQTELALRQVRPEEIRHALMQIHTSSARTIHLVNQLLSLARAEPGWEHEVALAPLQLVSLAQETSMEWVPKALERQIDLGFETSGESIQVLGHALLLQEMLGNLLDNAIRYCPAGSQVTVHVRRDRNQAILEVADNGPGIPETEGERVFERFYRLPEAAADGCGLGLAIVQEIARAHGATVELISQPQHAGTCVQISFPATSP